MSQTRLLRAFDQLTQVMARLRRDCPWDRRQTHESLRRYLLEECHEVLEALDTGDRKALRDELGDLLFQIWFHAEVAGEGGDDSFDLADVVEGIAAKLVRRHPHVFEEGAAVDAAWVKKSWEKLKEKEGRRSRLDGVAPTLPALQAALSLQEKAASTGFDWPDVTGVVDKIREEIEEFRVEVERAALESEHPLPPPAMTAEFGDLLFALVNLARHYGINGEDALRGANRRFKQRFQHIEKRARESGRPLDEMTLDEMEALWQEAKRLPPGSNDRLR